MTKLRAEDFLELRTNTGVPVKNIEMMNGHYLIYKIPVEGRILDLPDEFKSKSIKNVLMVRGLVIKSSSPFRRKRAKPYFVWDNEKKDWVVKYKTLEGSESFPSAVPEGKCVLYNSYNVGRIKVNCVNEPLVVVRDIDIDAWFEPSKIGMIDLTSKAYRCA